jgi:hypothetical protein
MLFSFLSTDRFVYRKMIFERTTESQIQGFGFVSINQYLQPVCRHRFSGVPWIFIRKCIFASYSYKTSISYLTQLELVMCMHMYVRRYMVRMLVSFNVFYILVSHTCILIGQRFLSRYIFMLRSYPLFVCRIFFLRRHVPLANYGVVWVKSCVTLQYTSYNLINKCNFYSTIYDEMTLNPST